MVVYIVVFVPSPLQPLQSLSRLSQGTCSREGSSIVRHFIQTGNFFIDFSLFILKACLLKLPKIFLWISSISVLYVFLWGGLYFIDTFVGSFFMNRFYMIHQTTFWNAYNWTPHTLGKVHFLGLNSWNNW